MDDDAEPRDFSPEILDLRRRIVMQETGNATLKVKSHLDDMVSLLFNCIYLHIRKFFYNKNFSSAV